MVSEQLEESLRAEIESYVERRLQGIKEEIAQLQTQLNGSLTRLQEEKGEGHWDGSLSAAITEHLRGAHDRGVELAAAASSRAQASSDMAIIKASVEEIETQRSQTEVLKTLVNRASSFAPRVAFFVVKGEQGRGWRARGFQGTVGDEAIQQITIPLNADTVIGEAVSSRNTWSGTPGTHSEDKLFLEGFGEQAPQRLVSVPLVVRGRTVAVLYADSAALDADAINLEALETLVRVAAMAVELLSVAQAAATRSTVEPPPQPVEEPAAYTPHREYEPEPRETYHEEAQTAAAETEAAVEAPAAEVLEASAPLSEEPIVPPEPIEHPEPIAYSEPVADSEPIAQSEPIAPSEPSSQFETPVEAVAQTFESPAPAEPAPAAESSYSVLTSGPAIETQAAPLSTRRRYGSYDSALPVEVTDEDEKRQHNDARRFARLLVSEIKLYNEQKVVEGRSHGDLYDRLREYIDRSREMYDKRVKPVVSERYDYFHHELVNTLAEGDVGKLGETYPGTTVSA